MPASSVALVTLVTPVFALILGTVLNGEQVSSSIILGSAMIMGGLGVYFWGDRLLPVRSRAA